MKRKGKAGVGAGDGATAGPGAKRRCGSRTAGGQACRAWAARGTDPPRCAAHRDAAVTKAGEAPGAGAGFHSLDPAEVTVDEAIAGLTDKMRRLDRVIDLHERDMLAAGRTNGHLVKLFALYAQASTRLTNMLRARRALSGAAADGIARAIARALDELGSEWGMDL